MGSCINTILGVWCPKCQAPVSIFRNAEPKKLVEFTSLIKWGTL